MFKVTKQVSDREFEPRPFVSRPSLLGPCVFLALLLQKTRETSKKTIKKKVKNKEERGAGGGGTGGQ